MLSAGEIRNAKFAKSVGGYKQEEVDILLDKIEADYVQYERTLKEFQTKTEALQKEIDELKTSQGSIQSVLVSAQRLADQIVNEAKEKSEEIIRNAEANISIITAREKELSTTFERKAQERKATLEKELADMVRTAQIKADGIKAASDDSVARQQLLFEKLKLEVAAFKAALTAKYKEHLELLNTLPDSVPMDPKQMAQAVSLAVDKAPDPNDFISSSSVKTEDEPVYESDEAAEETVDDSEGFVIADVAKSETEN